MSTDTATVFTVGHSNNSLEQLCELLRAHAIDVVADVRSSPYSRFHPQFNRETLSAALQPRRLGYEFLGVELGGRSDDPSCYNNGRVDYTAVATTERFRVGLDRLLEIAQRARVVILCAEREPAECHRALLVGRSLADAGVCVLHIHADARTESQGALSKRLIAMSGVAPDQTDLFRSESDIAAQAYARQAARVAFADSRFAENAEGIG